MGVNKLNLHNELQLTSQAIQILSYELFLVLVWTILAQLVVMRGGDKYQLFQNTTA